MIKVNFLCIGAAKSGTTWLYHNLKQHPDIVVGRIKEIYYFNKYAAEDPELINPNYGKSPDWYHSFFPSHIPSGHPVGEFSTAYMKYQNCASDIFRYNPDMKIIAILRDPLERAFSHYLFLVQRGIVPASASFEKVLEKRPYIIRNSLYHEQLVPYFEQFPKEQIIILHYDDIRHCPGKVYSETLAFLGVSPYASPSLHEVVNPTMKVRTKWINDLLVPYTTGKKTRKIPLMLKRAAKAIKLRGFLGTIYTSNTTGYGSVKPEINEATRKHLTAYFKEDILALEKLLETNLGKWINEYSCVP